MSDLVGRVAKTLWAKWFPVRPWPADEDAVGWIDERVAFYDAANAAIETVLFELKNRGWWAAHDDLKRLIRSPGQPEDQSAPVQFYNAYDTLATETDVISFEGAKKT